MAACQSPEQEQVRGTNSEPVPQEQQQSLPPEKAPLTEEHAADFLRQYDRENQANEALIQTPHGDIRIRLYENTPLHRANFIYLTRNNYFNNTWFYRVSRGHVIQAGNTDDQKTADKRKALGEYKVPSEIKSGNYHKKGAVAAARSYYQNPDKMSDPYEFYIVLGKTYSRRELELLAEKHDMDFTEAQLNFYTRHTGAPHLDGEHTVFGEVIEGMDVVEKISAVEVDEGEWPLVNIPVEVMIVD